MARLKLHLLPDIKYLALLGYMSSVSVIGYSCFKCKAEDIADPDLLWRTAESALKCEQYDDALKYWQLFLENPKSKPREITNGKINIAITYGCHKRMYKEALEWYSMIDKRYLIEKNREGHIGYCYFQVQDYENALKWLRLYVRNPKSKDKRHLKKSYWIISYIYFMKGEYEMAIKEGFQYLNDLDVVNRNLELVGFLLYWAIDDVEKQLNYLKLMVENGLQKNEDYMDYRDDIIDHLLKLKHTGEYLNYESIIDNLLQYL